MKLTFVSPTYLIFLKLGILCENKLESEPHHIFLFFHLIILFKSLVEIIFYILKYVSSNRTETLLVLLLVSRLLSVRSPGLALTPGG